MKVVEVLNEKKEVRGKVNLGKEAGCRGINQYSARVVEKSENMGIIKNISNKYVCKYRLTKKGKEVYKLLHQS